MKQLQQYPDSEKKVQVALDKVLEGRAPVVVHRLSTIKNGENLLQIDHPWMKKIAKLKNVVS